MEKERRNTHRRVEHAAAHAVPHEDIGDETQAKDSGDIGDLQNTWALWCA